MMVFYGQWAYLTAHVVYMELSVWLAITIATEDQHPALVRKLESHSVMDWFHSLELDDLPFV